MELLSKIKTECTYHFRESMSPKYSFIASFTSPRCPEQQYVLRWAHKLSLEKPSYVNHQKLRWKLTSERVAGSLNVSIIKFQQINPLKEQPLLKKLSQNQQNRKAQTPKTDKYWSLTYPSANQMNRFLFFFVYFLLLSFIQLRESFLFTDIQKQSTLIMNNRNYLPQ